MSFESGFNPHEASLQEKTAAGRKRPEKAPAPVVESDEDEDPFAEVRGEAVPDAEPLDTPETAEGKMLAALAKEDTAERAAQPELTETDAEPGAVFSEKTQTLPIGTVYPGERVGMGLPVPEEKAEATASEKAREWQARLGTAVVGVAPDGMTFLPDDQRAAMLIDVAEQASASEDPVAKRIAEQAVESLVTSFGNQEDPDLQERIDALRAARPEMGKETARFIENMKEVPVPAALNAEPIPTSEWDIPAEYANPSGEATNGKKAVIESKEGTVNIRRPSAEREPPTVAEQSKPEEGGLEDMFADDEVMPSYVPAVELGTALENTLENDGLPPAQQVEVLNSLLAESSKTDAFLREKYRQEQQLLRAATPSDQRMTHNEPLQRIADQLIEVVRFQIKASGKLKELEQKANLDLANDVTRVKRVG